MQASGKPAFVYFTADWCVTCKVNERVILNSPEVLAAFRAHDVVAMKADWTNRDDGIARFLADHGLVLPGNAMRVTCQGSCLAPGSRVSVDIDWRVPLPAPLPVVDKALSIPLHSHQDLQIDDLRGDAT